MTKHVKWEGRPGTEKHWITDRAHCWLRTIAAFYMVGTDTLTLQLDRHSTSLIRRKYVEVRKGNECWHLRLTDRGYCYLQSTKP
jgi:hypothetical protein